MSSHDHGALVAMVIFITFTRSQQRIATNLSHGDHMTVSMTTPLLSHKFSVHIKITYFVDEFSLKERSSIYYAYITTTETLHFNKNISISSQAFVLITENMKILDLIFLLSH